MTQPYRLLLGLIFSGLSLLFATGCATIPDVRVDYNPAANFSQYKTFDFANPLDTDSDGYQSILSQRLIAASQRELEARGLRRVRGSAQLQVNFKLLWTERAQVTTYAAPMIGLGYGYGGGYRGWGWRSGLYGSWPLYPTQSVVTPYWESTLRIDIVDITQRQRVWVGLISDFSSDPSAEASPYGIEAAIAAAFVKFPLAPRAPGRQ
ncbi:MAG: DUF4136 domain-containing protein [Pseudomonadota bacterium]